MDSEEVAGFEAGVTVEVDVYGRVVMEVLIGPMQTRVAMHLSTARSIAANLREAADHAEDHQPGVFPASSDAPPAAE